MELILVYFNSNKKELSHFYCLYTGSFENVIKKLIFEMFYQQNISSFLKICNTRLFCSSCFDKILKIINENLSLKYCRDYGVNHKLFQINRNNKKYKRG